MSIRILIVEDEEDLREAMTTYLALQGFSVTGVGNAADFRAWTQSHDWDVVVMDLGLPDANGLNLIAEIPKTCGVILATAFGQQDKRLAGRQAGADDYLVKPFSLAELAATISNLMRRMQDTRSETSSPDQTWSYDPLRWTVTNPEGQFMQLTHHEAAIFAAMADNQGLPVTREELCVALGENPEVYDYRRLETLVRRLRAKAKESLGEKLPLTTVHGKGYAFTAPCRVEGADRA